MFLPVDTKQQGNFRGLTVTLAIAFIALSAIILLITGSLNMYYVFQNQQNTVAAQQGLIARDAANSVKNFIQGKFNRLGSAVHLGALANASLADRKITLEKLLGLEPAFRQVLVLDSQEQDPLKVSRLSDLATPHFDKLVGKDLELALEQQKIFISSIFIDEASSEPLVWMAVPITDIFGDVQGTVAAEVNLKFMWDLVARIRVGNSGMAYVVDRQGSLLAFRDISRVLKGENLSRLTEVGEFIKSNELNGESTAEISRGIQGSYVVSNHFPLSVPDWAVVVELPVQEAYQTLIHTFVILGLAMLLSFALTLVIGIYLSRKIARPLVALRDATRKISAGDLNARIKIESRNEIGDLAKSFNTMVEDLHATTVSRDALEKEVAVRKLAENALRESEERFKAIFEGSSDAVMLLTDKGFFDCNPATLEMFGFASVEEFSRVHPADISPPRQRDGTESFPAAMERITTAFETGSNRFEWVHRRKGGEDFPAEVLLTAFDMNGKRVLQATVRDITKRKQAEQALQESEEKYRALIETTDTGFLILDSQGRVLDANREYVRLSGHGELREILGRSVIEWTAQHSLQKNAEAVAQCVKDGMIRNLVIEYVNKSGGTIPVEINATVNGDGEKIRIISLCRDVTERRKAEQALAESEQSFRSMFDITPEGVVLISPKTGRFVAVNPAMRTLLGYSEEEFLSLSPEDITPPEAKEIMRCSIAQLEEGRSTADHEGITLTKDGSKVNVLVGNRLLQWHGGKVYYTTFKDITKRKQAELALAESEKNFRVMFEASTDALNLVGIEDGRFLEVNNAMCLMFGYSREELLCMSPRDLIDKENIPEQNGVRTEVLELGSVTSDEGTVVRKRDGTMLQVLISAQIVAWKGRRVIHSSLRDITPLKQVQDQLRKKNGEILEFTDMVTHDLKKPLTTMNIVLGLAKKDAFGTLNPDGVDAIDTGIEASHYMQEMLEDLLACARLESGTQELAIEEIRFMELANEILERLKFQIEEKKISVSLPEGDVAVMADRKQLTRVLMNLVGNAINYIGSGPDKFIKIGWERRDGTPVFMVVDNGIGVPEKSQKDLFTKFKRGSNVSGVQGTGLGLSIVKGIVEAHGGKIWFESEVGKGTTFYFTLAGEGAKS